MLDKKQCLIGGRVWRLIHLLSVMLFLSACANNVVVKSSFPKPLVATLPLQGSLTFTEDFENYTYFESAKARRSLKSMNIAEAQISLFNNVFSSLINVVGPNIPNLDLYIVPEVLEFQYSAPSETQLKHYEVWIKYRLKINNGLNQKIADWIIKGYGKTPTSLLSSSGSAFNAAATVALRDVGAQLAIQFPRQKVIQQLLKGEAPDVIEEAFESVVEINDPLLDKVNVETLENRKPSEKNKKAEKPHKWEVNNEI